MQTITKTALADRRQAAQQLLACYQELAAHGRNFLHAVSGGTHCVAWQHYPEADLIDHGAYCLSYYHAHGAQDSRQDEHGHFHVFARLAPLDQAPALWQEHGITSAWRGPPCTAPVSAALVHLVGISMNHQGVPKELFTSNQWVTNDSWCESGQLIALLQNICRQRALPQQLMSGWLNAMLRLFQPQITSLLRERDSRLKQWAKSHRGRLAAIHDQRLELLSSLPIAPDQHIRQVQQASHD